MENTRLTFGIVVDWPDPNSMYQGNLLKGIRSFAERNDINILTLVTGRLDSPDDMERKRELLFDFMNNDQLFSGFILFSSPLSSMSGTDRLLDKISQLKTQPMVSIAIDLPDMPAVMIDSRPGFVELIEHMILHHGYTNIAYISGPQKNEEAAERLDTVRQTFSKHNISLPDSHLYFGNFTVASGMEAVECFLDERKIWPEAIICANDYMAMGAWEKFKDREIAIPEDIALTGFDDLHIGDLFELPLTTIKQPLFNQGYYTAEKLYRVIKKETFSRITALPSEVVYRQTCGCDTAEIRTLPDIELHSKEQTHSYTDEFRLMFHEAVSTSVQENNNAKLIRCWKIITQSALSNKLRKSVITILLHDLRREYKTEDYCNEKKLMVEMNIDKMQLISTEAYVQSESLSGIKRAMDSEVTISNIETLGSDYENTLSMEDRLRSADCFFSSNNINNCYLSLFDNLEYKKTGSSRLIFCRRDGEEVHIPEEDIFFPTKQLLRTKYLPKERFEILVELLFDPKEIFGLLILDMKDVRFSFYEMLRTRLSNVIHDSINRQLLKDAVQRLENLSIKDDLTGLYNRRGFFTMSEQQLRYCIREKEPFAVYYIDMDGLKTTNDRYGHNEGDKAIKTVADIIRDSFRDTDIIARLGGDEFAVFVSNTVEENEKTLHKRILHNTNEVNSDSDMVFKISMSIGTCFSSVTHTDNPSALLDEMLKAADSKMYAKKNLKSETRSV